MGMPIGKKAVPNTKNFPLYSKCGGCGVRHAPTVDCHPEVARLFIECERLRLEVDGHTMGAGQTIAGLERECGSLVKALNGVVTAYEDRFKHSALVFETPEWVTTAKEALLSAATNLPEDL